MITTEKNYKETIYLGIPFNCQPIEIFKEVLNKQNDSKI